MDRIIEDQPNMEQSALTSSETTSNTVTTGNTQEDIPFITVATHPENFHNEQLRPKPAKVSMIRVVFTVIGVSLAVLGLMFRISGNRNKTFKKIGKVKAINTLDVTTYFTVPAYRYPEYYDVPTYFNKPKYGNPDNSWEAESCNTVLCRNAVQEIISSLNTSVDPCENFYDYACQGWQANNPRPTYSPEWTVFSKLEKKISKVVSEILSKSIFSLSWSTKSSEDFPALKLARNFYQDCMGYSVGTYSQPTTQSYKDLLDSLLQIDQSNYSTYNKVFSNVKPTTLKPFHLQGSNKNKYPSASLHKDAAIYDVMLNTLNQHGGWPLLQEPDSWNSSKFDLTKSMVAMKQKFASPIFLDVTSVQDPLGRLANNSIYISRPSPSGSLTNVIEQADKQAVNTIYALRDFIVNVSKELLIFQGKTNINETYLEDRAWEIIAVESQLQIAAEKKAGPLFKLVYGINQTFVKTNALELQIWLDAYTYPFNNSIQISDLILQMYYPILYGKVNLPIKVTNMDYVLSVSRLLSELKPEVLVNYIMFKMVTNMIPFSTQKMQDHFTNLKNSLRGTSGKTPRKETCTSLTQEKFQIAVGRAYIQQIVFNHFDNVKGMFQGIQNVFVDLVTRSTIPYFNKTILLAELEFTELCLGYPDFLSDKKKVQSEYYGLSLHQSTFLEKLMAVNTWLTNKQLNIIDKPTDLTDVCKWPRFAGTVGAFNQLQDFLVSMLQSPFYNVGLPKALNYGTLGSILGHEIIHGLVGTGWSELKNGSLTPVSECLVNQYGNFSTTELQEKNVTVDGMITLRENIPDNAGLLGAFQAYKKEFRSSKLPKELENFNEDQLFFIGFAQNWCHSSTSESFVKSVTNDKHGPGMFRVLGTLQNSKEFANAWNCPVGSKMNPAPSEHKKCTFF